MIDLDIVKSALEASDDESYDLGLTGFEGSHPESLGADKFIPEIEELDIKLLEKYVFAALLKRIRFNDGWERLNNWERSKEGKKAIDSIKDECKRLTDNGKDFGECFIEKLEQLGRKDREHFLSKKYYEDIAYNNHLNISRRTLRRIEEAEVLPNEATIKRLRELFPGKFPDFYNPRAVRDIDGLVRKYALMSKNTVIYKPDFLLDTLYIFKEVEKLEALSKDDVIRYKSRKKGEVSEKAVGHYTSILSIINLMQNSSYMTLINGLDIDDRNVDDQILKEYKKCMAEIGEEINCEEYKLDKETLFNININIYESPSIGYLAIKYMEQILGYKRFITIQNSILYFCLLILQHCADVIEYVLNPKKFNAMRKRMTRYAFLPLYCLTCKEPSISHVPEFIDKSLLEEYMMLDVRNNLWDVLLKIYAALRELNLHGVYNYVARTIAHNIYEDHYSYVEKL